MCLPLYYSFTKRGGFLFAKEEGYYLVYYAAVPVAEIVHAVALGIGEV